MRECFKLGGFVILDITLLWNDLLFNKPKMLHTGCCVFNRHTGSNLGTDSLRNFGNRFYGHRLGFSLHLLWLVFKLNLTPRLKDYFQEIFFISLRLWCLRLTNNELYSYLFLPLLSMLAFLVRTLKRLKLIQVILYCVKSALNVRQQLLTRLTTRWAYKKSHKQLFE